MSYKITAMTPQLHDYLLARRSERDPVLAELVQVTRELGPRASMQISPEQGAFMTMLTQVTGARSAIEVGTFTGYSGLCVARGLPADGRLLALDIDGETTKIARRFWDKAGLSGKIELRIGPALDSLRALPAGPAGPMFDLAFIDADKGNYRGYYEEILPRLRPGGLILIDNVLWSGYVIDETVNDEDTQAIRALNDFLPTDPRVDVVMLPIADGLTLVRKRPSPPVPLIG